MRKLQVFISALAVVVVLAASGCASETEQQRQDRETKMRQDAAAATEKAKPALEAAGKEINQAADRAASDARAAVQGAKDGWADGHHPLVNLNTAAPEDLMGLPGIDVHQAHAIVQHRPYADKHELVTRQVLTQSAYDQISDKVTAN
ncbi:MAG TPA: helix-hairpin-helix domain-containing protein [Candidatus Acidoferrales bacterium]